MFKSLRKNSILESLSANDERSISYLPLVFTDNGRFAKIKTVFSMIDKIYKDHAEKNHFPGYAFGIMLDNHLIYSGGGGYADVKKKIPVTSQSMFRIASITKSFTAMAIIKLRDECKLKLDNPVSLYIPEIITQQLTQDSPEITIRDLLTHSAGFPQDDPWADRNLHMTDRELIALLIEGASFSNVPGTVYEYSNLAFAILGLIIKQISGISYQEFIAANIWKPLGMEQAAWEFTNISPEHLVRGYKQNLDYWEEEELLHDGSFSPIGGMIASIESFSRYVAFHQSAWPPRDEVETGPLKRSSIREMHRPWQFNELNIHSKHLGGQARVIISAYGYGLRWLRDDDGKIYIGHSGGLPGFGCNWFMMPEYGIAAMLFTNVTYGAASEINLRVLDTLIKEAQLKPRQLPPSQLLKDRQNALLQLLPNWEAAQTSGIFAENFFLDSSLTLLKKQTDNLFQKAGKIIHISEIIPENQLRGSFIIKGEKASIKVSFTLTPQNPPLIQKYCIEEVV